ncbi:MAG: hypothetical protein K2M43_01140 [Mycoplasmoidaceae bacterium]|nr:hypothetical protein [Mycoplasmoidaceae bacterium]
MSKLKYMKKFELLPYHTLAVSKYKALKIPYRLKGVKEPSKEMIKEKMQVIKSAMED